MDDKPLSVITKLAMAIDRGTLGMTYNYSEPVKDHWVHNMGEDPEESSGPSTVDDTNRSIVEWHMAKGDAKTKAVPPGMILTEHVMICGGGAHSLGFAAVNPFRALTEAGPLDTPSEIVPNV
jgi:hypothetical protein